MSQVTFLQRVDPIKRLLVRAAFLVAVAWNDTASSQETWSVQVPTTFVEDGQAVALELVYRKPVGPGPFPTLLFTHGSTNNGSDPREVRFTATYPELSAYLNERGWLVAILQRRGRGKSGGTYAEGWDPVLGRYACSRESADAGQLHALADIDAAYDYLARDPLVDRSRLLIGGNSRGGLLALMHAARNPSNYGGVINFVGGWSGQRCNLMDEINARALALSANFTRPTLWLYGERDPYYSSGYGSSLFSQFIAAGGKGSIHVVTYGPLRNDHLIVRTPSLWTEQLSNYLEQLGARK
jgi:dienelactone hydrolase